MYKMKVLHRIFSILMGVKKNKKIEVQPVDPQSFIAFFKSLDHVQPAYKVWAGPYFFLWKSVCFRVYMCVPSKWRSSQVKSSQESSQEIFHSNKRTWKILYSHDCHRKLKHNKDYKGTFKYTSFKKNTHTKTFILSSPTYPVNNNLSFFWSTQAIISCKHPKWKGGLLWMTIINPATNSTHTQSSGRP